MPNEYKVIKMAHTITAHTEWEAELNDAAKDGWELASTPATGEVVYAVMTRPATRTPA